MLRSDNGTRMTQIARMNADVLATLTRVARREDEKNREKEMVIRMVSRASGEKVRYAQIMEHG